MPGSVSLTIVALLAVTAPATIDWRAPAECPDAAEVTAMMTHLLRAQPAGRAQLEVHATVVREAGRFQLALELRSTHGQLQRALAADDCLLLARATALVVAVHLDPLSVSQSLPEPVSPAPSPAVAVPPPPSPVVLAPPPPRPAGPAAPAREYGYPSDLSPRTGATQRTAGAPGGHLRLEGGLGYGVAPAIAGELALLGGVRGARWRLEGGFAAAPAREVRTADGALGGRSHRLAGVLRACAVWRLSPDREAVAIHGCLGGELGAVGATGTRGVTTSRTGWSPWGAVLVGPAVRLRLVGPLGLRLGVEAVLALARPVFTVGAQEVFQVAPASVRATIGLDLQFVARKRRARTTQ